MKNMQTENISEPCRKNRLQMTLKILESWAKFTKFDQLVPWYFMKKNPKKGTTTGYTPYHLVTTSTLQKPLINP